MARSDAGASENQFFINLGDNAGLDPQGFVVFGTVRDDSMAVADAIAGLPILNGWAWLPPPLRVVLRELPVRSDVLDAPEGTYGCVDPLATGFLGTQGNPAVASDGLLFPVSTACIGAGLGTGCGDPDQSVQEADMDTLRPASEGGLLVNDLGAVVTMTCDEIAASDAGYAAIEQAAGQELVEIQQAVRLPEPGALWGAGALGLPLALLARGRRAGRRDGRRAGAARLPP